MEQARADAHPSNKREGGRMERGHIRKDETEGHVGKKTAWIRRKKESVWTRRKITGVDT